MITLSLLHLQELNPPWYNTERRCGQSRPRSRSEKERECMLQAPGCRRRADPREQPCACSPWWWLMQAGHTRPSRSAKLKAYFVSCKGAEWHRAKAAPHPSSLFSPPGSRLVSLVSSTPQGAGRGTVTRLSLKHMNAHKQTHALNLLHTPSRLERVCLMNVSMCVCMCACVSGCFTDHRDTASHKNTQATNVLSAQFRLADFVMFELLVCCICNFFNVKIQAEVALSEQL